MRVLHLPGNRAPNDSDQHQQHSEEDHAALGSKYPFPMLDQQRKQRAERCGNSDGDGEIQRHADRRDAEAKQDLRQAKSQTERNQHHGVLHAALLVNASGCGTVIKRISHGKMTMPKAAHTAQMFSHFHTLAYLMGAAKLPLMIPAMIARTMPTDTARHEMTSDVVAACGCPSGRVGPHQTPRRRPDHREEW